MRPIDSVGQLPACWSGLNPYALLGNQAHRLKKFVWAWRRWARINVR
jgi:hypothetical protein